MFFSVITKNLNWGILTKNSVLKDGIGLKKKNFIIMGVHWKIGFLGAGLNKNYYIGRKYLKRGFGQLAALRRSLAKIRGVFFEAGWYPSSDYASSFSLW